MGILEEKLQPFELKNVKLLNLYEQNAFALEIKYLLSLEENRFLRGFCDVAGVESDAELYGGWEDSDIKGHTLGHYLVALSQGFSATENKELKRKIDRIVDVLFICQNRETGYLAAIPESHYDKLETGNPEGTWVPWYTMHKVMSGLLAAYELGKNTKALEIASRLGDWVFSKVASWSPETQQRVLSIEYGGMNDCLYMLYSHTLKKEHLAAAHCFDELPLFTALWQKKDILDGKHANTTIPKFIGALKRYSVLGEGEEFYLQAAESFWHTVTENHSYITGGNSEWEHFGSPGVLDAERTECNCETCNSYNMLKLTRELFRITGEKKYADFYERAYINAILSSQNPETGMTTYFQPMATGFFKVYSSATEHFWCCTGSGMENFTKLGNSIYFKDRKSLYVLRYTSSEVNDAEREIILTQHAELPKVIFSVKGSAEFELALRVPDWSCGSVEVKVNGEAVSANENNGFIRINRLWCNGDRVECCFPMKIDAHSLPDNKNAVAFTYGPYVLSADMGTEKMNTSVTGVNVTVPLAEGETDGRLTVTEGTVENWLENISRNFVKQDDGMSFILKGTDKRPVFSPHYRQHGKRYGIYFELTDKSV